MADYTIRARFEIEATPAEVQRWLDDPARIAGWWSDRVVGAAAAPGDRFEVTFPGTPVVFSLEVKAASDDLIEWYVPESPPWWQGTTITFALSKADSGGTSLLFTHAGFEPADPIIEVITPAWVRFLDNLTKVVESGTPDPAVVN